VTLIWKEFRHSGETTIVATKHLVEAVKSVDWVGNVVAFCNDKPALERVDLASKQLAHWSLQFEAVDGPNPALGFVREMQISAQHVAALLAVSMYKSAAASMRNIVETALYYSYFRTHPTELATLVRKSDFYLSKTEIIDYHKVHTENFQACQIRFSLVDNLGKWYSKISAIVHGQLPGVWVGHTKLSEIEHDKTIQDFAIAEYSKSVELVHHLFLCTVGRELWATFSTPAKVALLHGISGDIKATLKLDSA